MRSEEELRRAQELLRFLRRRGGPVDVDAVAAGAGVPGGAVRAAIRRTTPEPRVELPADGSVPRGPGLLVRELAVHTVPTSQLVRGELDTADARVRVRESVVERDGRVVQFRTCTSVTEVGSETWELLRPVDVEAVRADEDTAAALGVDVGTVVLLQVVLTAAAVTGPRRLEFAYSRADLVRVRHP